MGRENKTGGQGVKTDLGEKEAQPANAVNGQTALPRPYYQDSSVTIYHGDCRKILPDLGRFDLLLTDPSYGINWHPRVNNLDSPWKDGERSQVDLVGGFNCVWGGNYFTDQLPVSESWLIWIKRPAGFDFDGDARTYSVIEMAWSDFGGKPRMRNQCWDGGKRAGDSSNRHFCHPAQKPLELMTWCITECPDSPQSILDPFMGSGTTLRAAKDLGRRAIGIEIEERYCEIAAKRMEQEILDFGASAICPEQVVEQTSPLLNII